MKTHRPARLSLSYLHSETNIPNESSGTVLTTDLF